MRSFHRASARIPVEPTTWSDELADPAGGHMICHNDVCLENVVFHHGQAVGFLILILPPRAGRSSISPPVPVCVFRSTTI